MDGKKRELAQILDGMDVPAARKNDLGWLGRNLGINNAEHPNLARAKELVNELRKQANSTDNR